MIELPNEGNEPNEIADAAAEAEAAMKAEWAEIKEFVLSDDSNHDHETMLRRSARMREFLEKHGAVFERRGIPAELKDPRPMIVAERRLRGALERISEMEDRLLEMNADASDARMASNLQMLERLWELENQSEEVWAAHEPARQAETMDLLLDLRNRREELLQELPLEMRQEWERKLGNEDWEGL